MFKGLRYDKVSNIDKGFCGVHYSDPDWVNLGLLTQVRIMIQ